MSTGISYSSRETVWHGSTKYCTVNDNFEEENYDLSYSIGKTLQFAENLQTFSPSMVLLFIVVLSVCVHAANFLQK